MFVHRRARVLAVSVLIGLGAALVTSAVLQGMSGGVRVEALGPGVLALSSAALGGLIVFHRPRLRLGVLLLATGLGFGVGALAASVLDYGSVHAVAPSLQKVAFAIVALSRGLVVLWTLFILLFPSDEFAGAGWRRFFVASSTLTVATATVAWLVGPVGRVFDFYQGTSVRAGLAGPFGGTWPAIGRLSDLLLFLPLVALGSVVQRYRHGDLVVRQQVRWFLVAMALNVAAQVAGAALSPHHGWPKSFGLAASIVSQALPMAAATVAILRYRLWEIDLVISRALVYGVLWAAVSALVLAPPMAAGLLVGGRGALAAVGAALLVTVVFQPTRQRLEQMTERFVYRHRARPYVLLTGFWETLRTADLPSLGPVLARAVHSGIGVRWAGVWLYDEGPRGGTLSPIGTSGVEPGAPITVADDLEARLRESPGLVMPGDSGSPWPDSAAAIVPLVAADELVGVLVCGPRRGDALGAADFEFLELLARECSLRLRNLRLEGQLLDRLAQIELQSEELRRSRQRLVAAEDSARRRIERNLHDGVQQQLVSLAVRLRRASAGRTPDAARLADLADEAEQAVFALQELGRGIYPSVLSDQGLAAALRGQAARLPVPVRIEVDGAIAGRRLDRAIEAAFYYVALEALTNCQKHASEASVALWLHLADGEFVLDVVDDGPGFERRPSSGTGLLNMEDRMAAVGGRIEVTSAPGSGTRVTARFPADERARQPAEADSRR